VRRRSGRSQPKNLGKLVPQVLEDLGIGGSARIMQLSAGWEAAVGVEIARHCRPLQFRGEVLDVEVESSVWCQQLKLQTPQLLKALSAALGDAAPQDLRFRLS